MSYHRLLGFNKEPFSTSPDPEFFYLTKEHDMALTNILIELNLKRGLTVIFGDVGTGKTTLSRKLVQELKKRSNMAFHIILNPSFENEKQFLLSLVRNFGLELSEEEAARMDPWKLLDAIEEFLIQTCVNDRRTVILIIDESQKMDMPTLETLRVLLNFETNEFKLMQLVMLGQMEMFTKLLNMPNFMDRISFKYTLNPLDPGETKELIAFRLQQAGYAGRMDLFLDDAIHEIYNFSRGYPRRITMLCHQALKELVIQNKCSVDRSLVRDVIEKERQALSSVAEMMKTPVKQIIENP
jgi:general secretion pathway protein A